jgi:DNA-binding MarR family transcriptional regulator
MPLDDVPVRVPPDYEAEYPDGSRSAAECGANLVRTTQLLLAELDRRRRITGDLNASTSQVLAIVEGAGEPLAPHVIAERLIVTSGTMTSLLDTLERREHIRRIPHPTDRRKILVDLTDGGRAAIDALLPNVHGGFRDAFEPLSEDERESLIVMLGRVAERLRELQASDAPLSQERRNRPRRGDRIE